MESRSGTTSALVSQLAEETDSKPVQCGFESHRGHRGIMLYTIGHGAKTAGQLTDALRHHDINLLVDVRSFPGSRRNPDVSKQVMPDWLGAAGIGYRHEPDLGGRRKPPASPVPRDLWWGKPGVRELRGAHPYTRLSRGIPAAAMGCRHLQRGGDVWGTDVVALSPAHDRRPGRPRRTPGATHHAQRRTVTTSSVGLAHP